MDLRVKVPRRLKVLSRPEDGLRALAEHAPQAEAFAERAAEKCRPAASWLYTYRRKIATVTISVLTVWLFVHVMFGANGMVVYRQKHTEYESMQKEVDRLQKENDLAEQQIKALKTDSKTIEKEAREQLHYVRPGEVVYVPPQSVQPAPPDTRTAHK